ncbi:putative tricarboxylate transport protein, mitochondrial [Scaptodrosophila lebanonensis]|uniref:Citrate transport protein n=1 Tax=Drosophila lebanonensis TaxID=7225 RepID=A0A6J2T684_DROLE|nr:putative tricarboxylate transport protein, mitochondrial [Scaptodrosophila lebanonensis]XP_030370643.1 putative tricarboxylate transport protein, mitochondrial [Scaptodrosophila lebanonensis]
MEFREGQKIRPVASGGKGLKGIVAGGITGGIEVMITYPTEFVKTQLQLDEKGKAKKYTGIVDCVAKTIKERGFFGLYRGLSVLLVGSIPKCAVRFGGYEFFSHLLQNDDGSIPTSRRFLAGMCAGISEAFLAVTPMETVKVKFISDMRSGNPQYKGLIHGVGRILKTEGIGGLYKGLPATVVKQGSNQAIRFATLYSLKDWYTGKDPMVTVPKPLVGAFGAIAGLASVLGNNPVDVVKTRMQSIEASKYKGSWDCFFTTLREEGPFAFYKGTLPRLSRVCIDVGITFMLYDTIMDIFKKVWR